MTRRGPVRLLRRLRDDAGFSTLEFLVITPILFTILCLTLQLGVWYLGAGAAATAARKGAETGSSYQSAPADGATRARDWLSDVPLVQDVEVSTDGSTADRVRVTVTAHVMNFVPFWDITIRRSAEDVVEK
ncbi:TadE/TadG family type IV pilus assembly protein [Streptomyces chartreusis]